MHQHAALARTFAPNHALSNGPGLRSFAQIAGELEIFQIHALENPAHRSKLNLNSNFLPLSRCTNTAKTSYQNHSKAFKKFYKLIGTSFLGHCFGKVVNTRPHFVVKPDSSLRNPTALQTHVTSYTEGVVPPSPFLSLSLSLSLSLVLSLSLLPFGLE